MVEKVSIVIPLLNEAENIPTLCEKLTATMDQLDVKAETVIVDDGSTDDSWNLLKIEHDRDKRINLIRLGRNFGQTPAMNAGFDAATGDVIVTMDADLQNDPADVPKMIEKMKQGYDIVSGWRKNRKDKFLSRKMPSMIANRLIGWLTGTKLHDTGCTLKAYKASVISNLRLYGEMHRFIPALASWQGVSIGEIEVSHHPRTAGRSKYTIWRAGKVILDLITLKFLNSFATKPIYVFGGTGAFLFFLGIVSELIVFYQKYLQPLFGDPAVKVHRNPMFVIGILFLLVGVNMLLMGLLAEMIIRTYHESQAKPTYSIKEETSRND